MTETETERRETTRQASLWQWDANGVYHLPEAQKRDYVAVEHHGHGVNEWADEIGIAPATVSRNLKRARENIGENNQ